MPDPRVHDLRIGTIHSLCDTLLAEFSDAYMASGTELIDDVECAARLARAQFTHLGFNSRSTPPRRVVNRLIDSRELVALFKAPWELPTWPSSSTDRVSFISAILNQQTETWYPRCAASMAKNGIEVAHGPVGLTDDLIKLQTRWEDYLTRNQVLDFATVQKRFLDFQDQLVDRLDHVFVDEFQDNNPIQFAIHTNWLKNEATRLTVVGDDDQALYRFRGSDIACFTDLKPHCKSIKASYRRELLETNYRSTKRIVDFTQAFRAHSALTRTSLPKNVNAAKDAKRGQNVRMFRGPWEAVCECVAQELHDLGIGRINSATAAVIIFSTSEASSRSVALPLRDAIGRKGVRVYNPRNKTAARLGSPVFELLGLISYFFDPVSLAPVGKNGRRVEVAASMSEPARHSAAKAAPPSFHISPAHLSLQKAFIKENGAIGSPGSDRLELFDYLDAVRTKLAKPSRRPRLTLAGLIARVLCFGRYRKSGFTPQLFRQALFTQLLEAQIAPSRRTSESLDKPIELVVKRGKFIWPDRYWNLLNWFGAYLQGAGIDDLDVEEFETGATLLLTFHQAKGLEFDHVYVAGTGREPEIGPALRTELFSGKKCAYTVDPAGALASTNRMIRTLAEADRDREVYVGVTRAKMALTLLHDPSHDWSFLALHPVLKRMFSGHSGVSHPAQAKVRILEYLQ